ncbi:MAG TPA: amidohydrolase family protein [Burkholderiales bacterium]|nr:amidohydrolase family protein [Burkholderiales bacterium]
MTDYGAIDADAHIIEGDELFTQYLPEPLRSRAPGLQPNEKGARRFYYDGFDHPPFPDEISIRKPMTAENRIKVLDKERIWAALLFPSGAMCVQYACAPDVAKAVTQAYLDWIADYVSEYSNRLFFAAPLPLQDVQWAAAEARRAVKKGARAIVVRPNPCEGRTWDNPAYDTLYATVQDLGVPFVFHETTGDPNTAGSDRYGIRNSGRYAFNHVISHSFEQMFAAMSVLCGGVLERFPRLKVVFAEAGCGWVPYWLGRLDGHHEHRVMGKQMPITMAPSEYFRRQCYVTCEPDDETASFAAKAVGADKLLFSTDYPHFDSSGGAIKAFEEVEGLSPAQRRQIMWDNAARLFGMAQ